MIDAGFLELVRLGVLPANDPDVRSSLTVVDDTIERTDAQRARLLPLRHRRRRIGGRLRRLLSSRAAIELHDDRRAVAADRHRHRPPVAGAERRARRVRRRGRRPRRRPGAAAAMQNMQSGQGLEPEQAWEDPDLAASPFGTDPATASIGFVDGQPAGSASPLTWAQAQYARLALDLSAGRNLETPEIVTDRYVSARDAGLAAGDRHLAGARRERDHLDRHGHRHDRTGRARRRRGARRRPAAPPRSPRPRADSTGQLDAVARRPSFGTTTITVTRHARPAAPATRQQYVIDVALPGTHRAERHRPDRRRQRAGHLPVPDLDSTSRPGAFDLTPSRSTRRRRTSTSRQAPRPGPDVRVQLRRPAARHLRPQPGARRRTSTAAAFPAHATTRSRRPTPGASGSRRRASHRRSGSTPGSQLARHSAAVRRRRRRRHGDADHARVGVRHGRLRLGVHRRADRPGRDSAPTRRATFTATRRRVHVRRLRTRRDEPDLLGRSRTRSRR